jgi:hypothetical protein
MTLILLSAIVFGIASIIVGKARGIAGAVS